MGISISKLLHFIYNVLLTFNDRLLTSELALFRWYSNTITMKQLTFLLLLIAGVGLGMSARAQQPFTNCSAAFVGNRMVVDTYSPAGKCKLAATASGTLTVQTVVLSPKENKAIDPIDFKVAIRDNATGTLHLYSDETYRQVPVQNVLARCRKGDQIVLLTVDTRYALPHNEILVK